MMIGNTDKQYGYVDNMAQLYKRLQDEQSKELFWARLQFDLEPDMDTAVRLNEIAKRYRTVPAQAVKNAWREEFAGAADAGKKIVLYGAGGNGKLYAAFLRSSRVDFYAFCDKSKAGETVCGKPVLKPEELLAHPTSYAVVISTERYHKEVFQFLQENGFPTNSILCCFDYRGGTPYFEFPELFKLNTAFVDAGCYDGTDTIRFSEWCSGAYSKIYAFEPDADNYACCRSRIKNAGIRNTSLLQAGLSDVSGEAAFAANASGSSYLLSVNQDTVHYIRPDAECVTIQTTALDEVVDTEIGMIKMDIEGAEFDALHGSERVIQRDKPLLAICVYHRQGDMLAIMDYLHSLVPEYRFWLRHYGVLIHDTVLYAAV